MPRRRPIRATRHHVADFSSLPELIEHARAVDGATHVRVTGRATTIFFPMGDGRYEAASPWQERGYWHCPAAGKMARRNYGPSNNKISRGHVAIELQIVPVTIKRGAHERRHPRSRR
jgi:hypothetical protein